MAGGRGGHKAKRKPSRAAVVRADADETPTPYEPTANLHDETPRDMALDAPTADKIHNEVRAVKKQNSASNIKAVMYIGHLPNGFFEEQMKAFFSQFGTVNRVRVARNAFGARPAEGYEAAVAACRTAEGFVPQGGAAARAGRPVQRASALAQARRTGVPRPLCGHRARP